MGKENKLESGNASKCKKQTSKKGYNRKRKYYGNQCTVSKDICNPEEITFDEVPPDVVGMKTRRVVTEADKNSSVSSKKVKEVNASQSNILEGCRFIDLSILSEIVGLSSRPECQSSAYVEENSLKGKGLASYLEVICTNCRFIFSTYTYKGVKYNTNAMEVSVRSVYAMRRCGVGHQVLQKLCGEAVEKVAIASMIQTAVEIKEKEGSDIGVSFDGTWQRRGHSSLNGVEAAISITTGKVVDCEVLSRYCNNCALHIPLKETNPAVHEAWKVDHEGKCHLNHEGSASSMESDAAFAVFSRLVKNYGLRYIKYYGEGDSSSFSMGKTFIKAQRL